MDAIQLLCASVDSDGIAADVDVGFAGCDGNDWRSVSKRPPIVLLVCRGIGVSTALPALCL